MNECFYSVTFVTVGIEFKEIGGWSGQIALRNASQLSTGSPWDSFDLKLGQSIQYRFSLGQF